MDHRNQHNPLVRVGPLSPLINGEDPLSRTRDLENLLSLPLEWLHEDSFLASINIKDQWSKLMGRENPSLLSLDLLEDIPLSISMDKEDPLSKAMGLEDPSPPPSNN